MVRSVALTLLLLAPAPALAFSCPTVGGGAASVYDAAPGAVLRAEPRDDAAPVGALAAGDLLVVLEVLPSCQLPEGWHRADTWDAGGYVRAADLEPRASMPDVLPEAPDDH